MIMKAHHSQTFSKSHSMICFSIGQIKQTFGSLVHVRNMYAVYFGIRKNYTQAHKTARMTREYWCDRKENLRKT